MTVLDKLETNIKRPVWRVCAWHHEAFCTQFAEQLFRCRCISLWYRDEREEGLWTLPAERGEDEPLLPRSISDAGRSTLVRVIGYEAEEAGRTVVKVDRWFSSAVLGAATSPRASRCRRGCGTVLVVRPPATETSTPPTLGWREPLTRPMTPEDAVRRGTPLC